MTIFGNVYKNKGHTYQYQRQVFLPNSCSRWPCIVSSLLSCKSDNPTRQSKKIESGRISSRKDFLWKKTLNIQLFKNLGLSSCTKMFLETFVGRKWTPEVFGYTLWVFTEWLKEVPKETRVNLSSKENDISMLLKVTGNGRVPRKTGGLDGIRCVKEN